MVFIAQEHLGVSLAKLLEQCDSASICLSKVHSHHCVQWQIGFVAALAAICKPTLDLR